MQGVTAGAVATNFPMRLPNFLRDNFFEINVFWHNFVSDIDFASVRDMVIEVLSTTIPRYSNEVVGVIMDLLQTLVPLIGRSLYPLPLEFLPEIL